MEPSVSRRVTRSQTLQKRLADAALREKSQVTAPRSPHAQLGETSPPYTQGTRASPSRPGRQVSHEAPAEPLGWLFDLHRQSRRPRNLLFYREELPADVPPWPNQPGHQSPPADSYNDDDLHARSRTDLQSCHDQLRQRTLDWLGSVDSTTTNTTLTMSPIRNFDDVLERRASHASSMVGISGNPSGPTGTGKQSTALVELQSYRIVNLRANNILVQEVGEELPTHISELIQSISQKHNTSATTITRADVLRDESLHQLCMSENPPREAEVVSYFSDNVLPRKSMKDCLWRDDVRPMAQLRMPTIASESDVKLSTPVPDVLYGYRATKVFLGGPAYTARLTLLGAGNRSQSLYPFLAIKYKGDQGSMWAATNQCLGAAATCVNITADLKARAMRCGSDVKVNTSAFSIATNGTEARLYVTWNEAEIFQTALVRSFLLQDPDHHIEFRKWIQNILDWARGERLEGIREAADVLIEDTRKRASEAAKSRSRPASPSSSQARTKRLKVDAGKARDIPATVPEEVSSDESEKERAGAQRSKKLRGRK